MQPYLRTPELLYRTHPEVEAARHHDCWRDFHRRCGEMNLFFDLPSAVGRSGFVITVFTTHPHRAGGRWAEKLGEGRGRSVFQAIEAAYRAAGRPVPAAESLIERMLGRGPTTDEFEELFG